MKHLLISFFGIISGCSYMPIHVTLLNDGSAIVKTARETDDSDLMLYKSTTLISNIDTNQYEVSFKISSIDSLGIYLPYLKKDL